MEDRLNYERNTSSTSSANETIKTQQIEVL